MSRVEPTPTKASSDQYAVITICHCDEHSDDGEPDEDCWNHWQVGIPTSGYRPESGHLVAARDVCGSFGARADAQLFADAKNEAR